MKRIIIICICLSIGLLACSEVSAQTPLNNPPTYPNGISVGYGLGMQAQKDHYLSTERYSGTTRDFHLSWARVDSTRGYRIGFEYRSSDNLRNNNLSAEVLYFRLYNTFPRRISRITLLSREAQLYFGPTSDLYFYLNHPRIASNKLYWNFSFLSALSIGCDLELFLPMNPVSQFESALQLHLISLGIKSIDLVDSTESPIRLMNVFSGMNTAITVGYRRQVSRSISLKLTYHLHVMRIHVLDELLTLNDGITLAMTIH